MKKLFVLGSLLTIFLFLFGCQSESPVAPADQDTSLEKVKAFSFTGENQLSNSGFVNVKLDWSAIRHVAGYKVIYTDLFTGEMRTVTLGPTELSYTANFVMLQQAGASCEITIQAFKLRKDTEIILYQGIQTFTYSGTSLGNMTFDGSIQNIPTLGYIYNIAPWAAQTTYQYDCIVVPSWSGSPVYKNDFYLFENRDFSVDLPSPGRPVNINDYVVITLYRYIYDDQQEAYILTDIGNQKIYYTPPTY